MRLEFRFDEENINFVCLYVDWNSLAAMLATNRSAGVTSEVNLRIPLHIANKSSEVINSGFETQGRHHQKATQRYQCPPPKKKTDVLQN